MKPTQKYLVVIRWDSYETSVHRFDTLEDALGAYREHIANGNTPILAQEITPTLTVTDLDGNTVTVAPTGN